MHVWNRGSWAPAIVQRNSAVCASRIAAVGTRVAGEAAHWTRTADRREGHLDRDRSRSAKTRCQPPNRLGRRRRSRRRRSLRAPRQASWQSRVRARDRQKTSPEALGRRHARHRSPGPLRGDGITHDQARHTVDRTGPGRLQPRAVTWINAFLDLNLSVDHVFVARDAAVWGWTLSFVTPWSTAGGLEPAPGKRGR